VLALLFLLEDLRRRRSALVLGGAVVAVAATISSYAVQGHSVGAYPRVLSVASDSVHLAAASCWIGGLVVLVFLLRAAPAELLGEVLPRWSRVAVVSVAVLVATGSFQSLREVGSMEALVETSYGRLLLVKLTLVAGLLGLGSRGRVWIRRRYTMTLVHAHSDGGSTGSEPDVDRLRGWVAGEVALGAVTLAVTSVLVATTPARVAARDAEAAAVSQPGPAAEIDLPSGVTVRVQVTPARVVTVNLVDAEGPRPDPQSVSGNASLAARGVSKLPLRLARVGPGRYRGEDSLPFAGDWRITVTVHSSDVEAAVGTADLVVP
jgi:copper transport protein